MKKLEFSIDIAAPREKVWEALWDDANYRQWTGVFQEGSFAETDWKEGSEVKFLSPENDGMYGIIEKMIPNEKMYFLHKGAIKQGEKQPESYDENAIERYDLVEKDGGTELTATLFAPEEYIVYFTNTFPKALEKVKQIAEGF